MAYTKTTWTHSTKFDTTNLNNCETQYDEAYAGAISHTHDDRYYTKTEMDAWFWWSGNDGHGSGMDCDTLYYLYGNMHFADFGVGGVQQYTIVMWDGVSLPSGWVECNGSNGTPDFRDTFVLGAGGSYSVGASGGYNSWTQNYNLTVASHAITLAELPSHTHVWYDGVPNGNGKAGGDALSTASARTGSSGTTSYVGGGLGHGHTGSYATINWTENKPPCVALRYIMKS